MQKNMIRNGTIFNRLTVIEHIPKQGYRCLCECGNITIARSTNLRAGKTKSCGCWNKDKNSKFILPDNQTAKNRIFKNYEAAAKRRKYSFELTKQEFTNLIIKPCHYCGSEHSLLEGEFKYNGVDRVDNTLGYTIENAVSCCKICNNSKASLSKEDWLGWLQRIFKFQVTLNDYPVRE